MAYALVGAVGAVSVGASGAAVTPAYGTGANRTAGDLLVCCVAGSSTSGTPSPTTPSGWSVVTGFAAASDGCAAIFYKVAAGSDAAPTIALQSGVIWSVQLMEFSGNAANSPLDQDNSGTGSTAGTLTVPNGAADQQSGELLVYCSSVHYSSAGTKTLSNALNNGATANDTNNNATSTANHYGFGYGFTTAHASADSDTLTYTASGAVRSALQIASFKLPIVHSDSPSGSITEGGSDTESKTGADSQSGTVTEGGSRSEAKTGANSPAGAISEAGSATDGRTGSDTGSGTVTLGGSTAEAEAEAALGTGTITLSGTVIEHWARTGASGASLDGGLLIPPSPTYMYRDQAGVRVTIDFELEGRVTGTSEEDLLLALT